MFSFSEAIGRFSSVVFAVATHGLVRKIALALIILPIVSFFAYRRLYVIRYPANLPRLSRIGDETGISWTQMRARFQTDCTAVFNAAYEQVSVTLPYTNSRLPYSKQRITANTTQPSIPRMA